MCQQGADGGGEVTPQEFLRALLKISPEDAERAREQSPATRKRPKKQDGPTADYGAESREQHGEGR